MSLRRALCRITCALTTLLPTWAHADDGAESDVESATQLDVWVRPFYRNDELVFSIDGGGIDTISELDWDDVRSAGLQLEGKLRLPLVDLHADVAYGRIYDGHIRDSDYAGNGKTLEFSRSRSDTERGSTLDVSIALGIPFAPGRRFTASPLLGLCYSEQNYNIRNGVQLVPATGPFGGLDSDYETRWYGFLWGGELHWLPTEDWDLMARFTSRHARYDADGHFNLRSDLEQPRSFAQSTNGRGSILEFQARRALGSGFSLDLGARWDEWDTNSGRMTFFLSSGGSSRQGLNEVRLDSFRVSLGLGYSF